MDQKTVKKLLLEAKNDIKNKQFENVVKTCEIILSANSNDYNALVFLGVALQELKLYDKALASFTKATKVSPNQILAWQGLQKYYENLNEHGPDLQDVYTKLLELINENDKILDLWHKLGLSYYVEKNFTKAEDCFMKVLEVQQTENLTINFDGQLWISLVICLISQTNLTEKQLTILQTGIDKIYDGLLHGKNDEFDRWNYESLEKYFNFLSYELLSAELLFETSTKFQNIFKQNYIGILKWKLRGFIIGFIMNKVLLSTQEIDEITSALSNADKEALALASFGTGIIFYINEDWSSSKESFKKGLALSPVLCWESWLLMCLVLDKLRDGISIEHYAKEGLKLICKKLAGHKIRHFEDIFYFLLGKGCFYQNNSSAYEKSVNEFLKISDKNMTSETFYFQGLSYFRLNRMDDFVNILAILKNLENDLYCGLNGFYLNEQNRRKEAKENFLIALGSSHKMFYDEWFMELGSICLAENEADLACHYYNEAAKANPVNARPHFLLGNYFKNILNDSKQSEIYYKQAYFLKKYDEEIGVSLSDIYYTNNNEDENFALLLEVTSQNATGRCKWAWLRLGILYLRQGAYLNSIKALQSALTADPLDKECWECLAEAYLKHGSYTSALKAFNRVLEIDSTMLYSSYQMANIKLTLGLYKEAAELFKKLLTMVPSYVPALKGLGESYLHLAQFYLRLCEPMRVRSFCQIAVDPLTCALIESPKLICLWKLMGDVCTLFGQLSPDIATLTVPSTLLKGIPVKNSNVTELRKKEILQLGARCYSLACERSSKCSSMYHDLAVNYYYQATESANEKVAKLNKALSFAKQAALLNSSNSSHWIMLGRINACPEVQNYRLAQHCFIQAVTVASKDPVAWTNLGIFYLLANNIKLAHKSLIIAQSLEPAYPNSWLGLAACAEFVGHDDAMDLFRHCTTLSNHVESSISYGSWACNVLTDASQKNEYSYHIKEMNAIPTAVDCVSQYISMAPDASCAYNILGLLLERQHLYSSAVVYFKKALQSNSETSSYKMDIINCNLARVLRKLHKYEESTNHAIAVKEENFFNICGLAFTYYLQNCLSESSATYELAFNMAQSNLEKAHLLVAMASIEYSVHGSDEAKTLLFQSCEVKPDCIQALLGMSALGILDGDAYLLTAALDELTKFQQDENAMVHISYLLCCQAILQGDSRTARNVICKSIHKWPANYQFWKLLSKHLLQQNLSVNTAVQCAKASMKLSSKPLSKLLQLLCVSYYSAGLIVEAFSTAKKLIHLDPGEKLNWEIMKQLQTCI